MKRLLLAMLCPLALAACADNESASQAAPAEPDPAPAVARAEAPPAPAVPAPPVAEPDSAAMLDAANGDVGAQDGMIAEDAGPSGPAQSGHPRFREFKYAVDPEIRARIKRGELDFDQQLAFEREARKQLERMEPGHW